MTGQSPEDALDQHFLRAAWALRPAAEAPRPAAVAPGPAAEAPRPAAEAHGPAAEAHGPAAEAHGPAAEARHPAARPGTAGLEEPVRPGTRLTGGQALALFDAQLGSRHLDLAARYLRAAGQGFYTIGSAGHEANASVAAALRPTDP